MNTIQKLITKDILCNYLNIILKHPMNKKNKHIFAYIKEKLLFNSLRLIYKKIP
jgi:hypothetical protein